MSNENNEQLTDEQILMCLYDKTFTCPVCEKTFKSKMIRKGKSKYIRSDIDLKPIYYPLKPEYYDVIVCNNCGYAAVSNKFDNLTYSQQGEILEKITPKYVKKDYPDIYDADTAIERYKLALLNCMVKKSRVGEKAYICLKLAWIYRDKEDRKNEFSYLKSAYDGFNEAFTTEKFPICGMDEDTLLYMIAAIGVLIGNLEDSKRILGKLIVKKSLTKRLKDKIIDAKERIKIIEENNITNENESWEVNYVFKKAWDKGF